jgi:hypothetical protein
MFMALKWLLVLLSIFERAIVLEVDSMDEILSIIDYHYYYEYYS